MPQLPRSVNWKLLPTNPDVWTPEYAWWLGLTFGDGNVYSDKKNGSYRIGLAGHSSERNTAEKWRALICPDATIRQASEHGIETYFYHAELAQWFSHTWFSGDKMSNMRYPAGKVPANVFHHWVRGLIDSDGGMHLRQGERGNPAFLVDFCSAVPGFTTALAADLMAQGLPKVAVQNGRKTDAETGKVFLDWRLRWSCASALAVAVWLYEGSAPSIREDNRYAVYRAAFKQHAELALPCTSCDQKPKFSGGLCKECLWKTKPRQSDKPCSVCWSRPCTANNMCNACFKAAHRSAEIRSKRTYGNCTVCSSKLHLRGVKRCPACAKAAWETSRLISPP